MKPEIVDFLVIASRLADAMWDRGINTSEAFARFMVARFPERVTPKILAQVWSLAKNSDPDQGVDWRSTYAAAAEAVDVPTKGDSLEDGKTPDPKFSTEVEIVDPAKQMLAQTANVESHSQQDEAPDVVDNDRCTLQRQGVESSAASGPLGILSVEIDAQQQPVTALEQSAALESGATEFKPILHPDLLEHFKALDAEWNEDLLNPPWVESVSRKHLQQTLRNCVPTMTAMLEEKGLLAIFAEDLDNRIWASMHSMQETMDRPAGELLSEAMMALVPVTPEQEHQWLLANCVEGTVPTEYEIPEDEQLTEDDLEMYITLERVGL